MNKKLEQLLNQSWEDKANDSSIKIGKTMNITLTTLMTFVGVITIIVLLMLYFKLSEKRMEF